MESSKNGLDRIRTSASKVEEAINNSTVADMTEAETKLAEEIPAFVKRYEDAMEAIELNVAGDDMGKVIGKQGRIAKSIRTVVKAAASKGDKKVIVDIK